MKISKFGGLIAAASKKASIPMLQVGSIPIIKRTVISFQQAGIFPIVIITSTDEEEIKCELSHYGVIFLSYVQPEHLQLLDAVKAGLHYLQGKCNQVAFAPVNVPMFTPDTLVKLKSSTADIVIPSIQGQGGHPVVLSENIVLGILDYDSPDGPRQLLMKKGISVWDKGILTSVLDVEELKEQISC